MRGIHEPARIFSMARRLLQGEIKQKFDQRYTGPETLEGLQRWIFEEISPRNPTHYYRRKFMSIQHKPGQSVEDFEDKFFKMKRALEMSLRVRELPEDIAIDAYRNALKGSVGKDLGKLWMLHPPSTLKQAMDEANGRFSRGTRGHRDR